MINVHTTHLGAIFQPDGNQMPDVRRRVTMTKQRHGKMRHVWASGKLHTRLKLRLYIAGVCSVMVYGAETWILTPEVQRMLNGANSQMVSKITGKTIREEAVETTRTHDIIASIRATRMRWLGQILRMEEDRLLKKAVKTLYKGRREGDILMDTPAVPWRELCKMAADEKGWQARVRAIKEKVHIKTKSSAKGGSRSKKLKKENKKKGGGDGDSDEDKDDDWGGGTKTRQHKRINSVVRCHDGFRMSVQASHEHFCTPRQDKGPYTHVEVGYPNRLEELLLPYADGASTIAGLRPTLYVNVPAEVVLETIEMHAGMVAGQLPELATSEASEAAYDASSDDSATDDAYAAPTSVVHLGAPPPPPPAGIPPPAAPPMQLADTEESDARCDSDGVMWAAACEPPDDTPSALLIDTSSGTGVMMGSPMSPTAFMMGMGQLSPPPALLTATFSPMQTTNLMIEDKKEEDHI